jgi:hypothetical protein
MDIALTIKLVVDLYRLLIYFSIQCLLLFIYLLKTSSSESLSLLASLNAHLPRENIPLRIIYTDEWVLLLGKRKTPLF